jgi:peroxiredoxin
MSQSTQESLAARMAALTDHVGTRIPSETAKEHTALSERLAQLDVAEVPRADEEAPDFELPNAHGAHVRLGDVVQAGPAVVTFYRGGWCPYCNLHLRAYQAILPQLRRAGATLLASSPQNPDNSLTTVEKNDLEFEVLSDRGNEVARRYGLAFAFSEDDVRDVLKPRNVDLPSFNGDDSWSLPIPGTFVIGRDRRVVLSFADGNFRRRLEPEDILRALDANGEELAADPAVLAAEARHAMDVSFTMRGYSTDGVFSAKPGRQ